MKIKYSNKLKSHISTVFIKELVQLTFSIVPYQQVHIFNFEDIKENKLCISHSTPRVTEVQKLYLSFRKHPNEPVVLVRKANTF